MSDAEGRASHLLGAEALLLLPLLGGLTSAKRCATVMAWRARK